MESGVTNLKELLSFLASLGEAVSKAREDDKFTISDVMLLGDPLMKAFPAFKDIDEVRTELADLDDDEKKELMAYFKEEFDLDDDKAELLIEEGLELVVSLGKFLSQF